VLEGGVEEDILQ